MPDPNAVDASQGASWFSAVYAGAALVGTVVSGLLVPMTPRQHVANGIFSISTGSIAGLQAKKRLGADDAEAVGASILAGMLAFVILPTIIMVARKIASNPARLKNGLKNGFVELFNEPAETPPVPLVNTPKP